MSEARDTILGRIHQALADVPPSEAGGTVPRDFRQTGTTDRASLLAEFETRARGYKVRIERASSADAAAHAARLLTERGLVRLLLPAGFPDDLVPEGFDIVRDQGLDNLSIAGFDGVLTTCACAVAQTGTIVLDHGAGQGRRVLTLLPDYHLCFVRSEQIVALVPEAVVQVGPAVAGGRPLTFISGPSATSDIELSRVEGVHGPRTLDIIVLV